MTTLFEEMKKKLQERGVITTLESPLKGRTLPEETRRKMSEAQKRIQPLIHTPEFNRKTGEAQIGKVMSVNSREKMRIAHLGKKLPEETKQHMSKAHKQQWSNPEFHQKVVDSLKPVFASREYRDSCSRAQLKRNQNIEEKNKRIEATKAGYTNEVRKRMSETREKMWQNPEYRDYTISATLKSCNQRPNIPESKLWALLDYICPNEYEYTGNGSLIINGLCPDFGNCNGQKKVIEMFGSFWHQGENPQDRINKFAELGFKCLVIWENELVDGNYDNVIEKIRAFKET